MDTLTNAIIDQAKLLYDNYETIQVYTDTPGLYPAIKRLRPQINVVNPHGEVVTSDCEYFIYWHSRFQWNIVSKLLAHSEGHGLFNVPYGMFETNGFREELRGIATVEAWDDEFLAVTVDSKKYAPNSWAMKTGEEANGWAIAWIDPIYIALRNDREFYDRKTEIMGQSDAKIKLSRLIKKTLLRLEVEFHSFFYVPDMELLVNELIDHYSLD